MSTNGFYSVYDVCILNVQFVCTNGFYSVYRRICFCLKTTHHNNAFTMQNAEIHAFYAVF